MKRDDKESPGIICAVARRAGTVAGASVVVGNRIAGCGGKTVTVATEWLKWPLKTIRQQGNSKRATVSNEGEPMPEQKTTRQKAAKALIAAGESAAVTAEPELKRAESNTQKTPSETARQFTEPQPKEGSLISDRKQAESKANEEAIAKAGPDDRAKEESHDREIGAARAKAELAIARAETRAEESIARARSDTSTMKEKYDKEIAAVRTRTDESITKAELDASAMREKYDKEIAAVKARADESITKAESAAAEAIAKAESQAEANEDRYDNELAAVRAESEATMAKIRAESEAKEASYNEAIAAVRAEVDKAVTKAESATNESVLELALKIKEAGKEVKAEAVAVEERPVPVIEPPVEQPVEEPSAEVQEQPSGAAADTEMPSSAKVTDAETQAAVFANATDKIIFTKALFEIASQDDTVRAGAAKTIAAVRHELSVRVLVSQMAFELSARVRRACVKALTTVNLKGTLPAVKLALNDEAASVRLAAVWGMYHLAKAESAVELIRMFADKDEEVRRRAATCFGWLGKEEPAAELLPLLNDKSVSVRLAAIKAMGNLGSRKVVSSLIDQLNDPVESIRKAVLTTIETITGKKMSKSFPKDAKAFKRLVARWQGWWKEELLG